MRYTVQLNPNERIAGFAAKPARGPGQVRVIRAEFLSSEDGQRLVERLEEISRMFFGPARAANPAIESTITQFLIVVHPNGTAEVYIDEAPLHATMKAKRSIEAGSMVNKDHIADVSAMMPGDVAIPDDCGYFLMFSAGWRKALLFDVAPLDPTTEARPRDLPKRFAAAYTYLLFQCRFQITEDQWRTMMDSCWFPFIGLSDDVVQLMIRHVQSGWDIDELLPQIGKDVDSWLDDFRAFVDSNVFFAPHAKVISEAVHCHKEGKYIVAASALFSRIEGILRFHHARFGHGKATQSAIVASAVKDDLGTRHPFSLLLPDRFKEYLACEYFGCEDFSDPSQVQKLTRHSVGHGVVPQDKLDRKASLIAILILRQLTFVLGERNRDSGNAGPTSARSGPEAPGVPTDPQVPQEEHGRPPTQIGFTSSSVVISR